MLFDFCFPLLEIGSSLRSAFHDTVLMAVPLLITESPVVEQDLLKDIRKHTEKGQAQNVGSFYLVYKDTLPTQDYSTKNYFLLGQKDSLCHRADPSFSKVCCLHRGRKERRKEGIVEGRRK